MPQEGKEPLQLEPKHVDTWMKNCAAAGVTTVLWRSNTGWTTYSSKLVPFAGSFLLPPNHAFGIRSVNQGWQTDDWEFLGE